MGVHQRPNPSFKAAGEHMLLYLRKHVLSHRDPGEQNHGARPGASRRCTYWRGQCATPLAGAGSRFPVVSLVVNLFGITKEHTMKTAISVDDRLMMEADRAAREIGVSRSRLFALALQSYLRDWEHDRILAQLNRVYGDDADRQEKRTATLLKEKFRSSTIRENW